MTDTYYNSCPEAIGANTWIDVSVSNFYTTVPNGLLYFGLRDKNNISNVVCLAVEVGCESEPQF
jgi:hypothetical protein